MEWDNVIVREVLNATWTILCWGAAFVHLAFLYRQGIRGGLQRTAGWYNEPANKLAVASGTYFIGEAFYRSWVFLVLLAYDHNDPVRFDARDHYWIAVVSASVAFAGGLCMIRLLSRDRWSHLPWLVTMVAMVAMAVFVRSLSL